MESWRATHVENCEFDVDLCGALSGEISFYVPLYLIVVTVYSMLSSEYKILRTPKLQSIFYLSPI